MRKLSSVALMLASCAVIASVGVVAGCQNASDGQIEVAETKDELVALSQAEKLQANIATLDGVLASGELGLVNEVLATRSGEVVLHLTYDREYDKIVDLDGVPNAPFSYAHPDWHPYFKETELHTTQSITKSITSLLIGIAETEGLIPEVETARLFDHINSAYKTQANDPGWSTMTIADLLAMRANFEWNEGDYSEAVDDAVILEDHTDDWVQYVLDKPMLGEPGGAWAYNSGATQLLSAVLEHTTGMSVEDYAKVRLFEPLGISEYYWKQSPAGLNDTLGGLYLTSTDLIKFCDLLQAGGEWNGKRLVSENFIQRSLSEYSTLDPDRRYRGYGYQWWLGYKSFNPKNVDGIGYGGQGLTCGLEEDTSIVIYSWNVPEIDRPDLIKPSGDVIAEIHTYIEEDVLPYHEAND